MAWFFIQVWCNLPLRAKSQALFGSCKWATDDGRSSAPVDIWAFFWKDFFSPNIEDMLYNYASFNKKANDWVQTVGLKIPCRTQTAFEPSYEKIPTSYPIGSKSTWGFICCCRESRGWHVLPSLMGNVQSHEIRILIKTPGFNGK